MNMVKLENTSDAAIYLPHTPEKDGAFGNDMTSVPRTKKEESTDDSTGQKTIKKTVGAAEIPQEVWERLRKNKVVATYLSSGRLRVAGSSGPPPESATPKGGKGQG